MSILDKHYQKSVSWKWLALTSLLVSTAFFATSTTSLGKFLSRVIDKDILYQARHQLGVSPTFSDRLWIVQVDDKTIASNNQKRIDLATWAKVIQGIQDTGVKLVVIDQFFDLLDNEEQIEVFKEAISKSKIPIATIGYVTPTPISEKVSLDKRYYTGLYSSDEELESIQQSFHTIPHSAYGAHTEILTPNQLVGHVVYNGHGTIKPFFTTTDGTIPHATFYAADSFEMRKGNLWLNHNQVWTNTAGEIPVNMGHLSHYADKSWSFRPLLERIKDGVPLDMFKSGDIVLFLPGVFTGNTDFVDTPLNQKVPGGYVMGALINSILTGSWIRPIDLGFIGIITISLLFGLLAKFLRPTYFTVTSVVMLSAIPLAAVYALTWQSIHINWLFPLSGGLLTGSVCFLRKTIQASHTTRQIRMALAGSLPDEKIDQFIKNPQSLDMEPSERLISVMFIDIEGFSLLCEQLAPASVFHELKNMIGLCAKIVHKHGGVVDKVIGDGLLVYFGYQLDGVAREKNHALQAIRCGEALQNAVLDRNVKALSEERSIFPIRIGINTANVFVGDLGGTVRVDPTIIGHGVNFAKRLEAACASNCIFISENVKDMLPKNLKLKFWRKKFRMKHREEPITGYEIDPVSHRSDEVTQIIQGYREALHIRRSEIRWPIPESFQAEITVKDLKGEISDFSENGFKVSLPEYFAKGVVLKLTLNLPEHEFSREIVCQIRWSRPAGDQFLHGLEIKSLADKERLEVVSAMRDFLNQHYTQNISDAV